jgi:hypothetical protein
LKLPVAWYRIAYVNARVAHSVVRPLHATPLPGDRITIDERTSLTVRKVVARAGGSITADVVGEKTNPSEQPA